MKAAEHWANEAWRHVSSNNLENLGVLLLLFEAAQADAIDHCLQTITATYGQPQEAFNLLFRQMTMLKCLRPKPTPKTKACPTCEKR